MVSVHRPKFPIAVLPETWPAAQPTNKWELLLQNPVKFCQYGELLFFIVHVFGIYFEHVLQSSYPLWEDMVARAAKLHTALRYSADVYN